MTDNLNAIYWQASEKLKDSSNYPEWRKLQYAIGKGKGMKPTKSSSTLDDDGYDSDEEDINADSEYATWLKGNAKAYMIIHKTTLLKERYQNKGFYLIGQSIDEFLHMSYNKDEDIAKFNDKFKNSANIRAKFRMEYTAKKLPDQSILETLMTDLLGEDRQVNKSLMVDNGQNGIVLYGNHPKSQN
ncbi:hypothetical protein VE00_10944 [Pseudogymnoascus sp. WSF 3629]|nr:hypothetical protein VE00_10944 [Pseudogymnoascus sp. WSF 3629]